MPSRGIGDLPEHSNWQGDFAQGSRTRVTNLPGFQSYRFFPTFPAELPHAPVFQQIFLSSIPFLAAIWPGNSAFGLFTNAPRGHTWDAAERSHGRMLLPLCGITFAGWLRQVVPREEVCLTLGGDHMREAPHAESGRQSERRAKVPPSWARGARSSLTASGFPTKPLLVKPHWVL